MDYGDNGGSCIGHHRGSVDYGDNGLADGVNKAILVNILRESLQGKGAEAIGSRDKVTKGCMHGSLGTAGVDVGLGCQEDLRVSSRGSKAACGEEGGKGNKGLHSAS